MTPTEFREYANTAFKALSEDYGLNPVPSPAKQYANEFQACFRSGSTLVIVEGTNYGFGVNIRLASTNRRDMAFPTYDFDDLLAIRAPDFETIKPGPDDTNEIQKKQIDSYVRALRQWGSDVLRGDFSSFPLLAQAIQARVDEQERESAALVAAAGKKQASRRPWWKVW